MLAYIIVGVIAFHLGFFAAAILAGGNRETYSSPES